jgi:Ca2+-binding EF-hand superfamily protein
MRLLPASLVFGGLLAVASSPAFAQDGASPPEAALAKLVGDLAKFLKAADADGNGTLNPVEFRAFVPAVRKAGEAILGELDPAIAQKKAAKDLKKYDKNADGALDDEEKKAMAEDRRLKEIKDFDWDGDGKLSEREQTAMQWAAEGRSLGSFRKIDTDANGELTAEELTAAISAVSGIKVKKPKPQ